MSARRIKVLLQSILVTKDKIVVRFLQCDKVANLPQMRCHLFIRKTVLLSEHLVDIDDKRREFSQPGEIAIFEQQIEELSTCNLAVDTLVDRSLKIDQRLMKCEKEISRRFKHFKVFHIWIV